METSENQRLPIWASLLLALLSGVVMDAGFPDLNIWPLTLVGVAMLLLAIRNYGFWISLQLGALAGAVFFGLHISWMTLYLGPVPWIALTVAMTLSFAIGTGILAWLWQGIRRSSLPQGWQLVIVAITAGAVWTVREAIASRLPYDGFSWGRIAFSQAESPFKDLLPWLGSAGLAFVLVATVAAILEGAFASKLQHWQRLLPLGVLVVLAIFPAWQPEITGTIRVAAVQGNADAALNSSNPRGTILQNHIDATMPIIDEDVDVVLWPENAADLDPTRNTAAARALNELSARMNAPFLVGTITERDGLYYNTALLWTSTDQVVDYYDKAHPVPFAEYMPDRDFFMALAPDLVGLVTRDYEKGETNPVLDFGDYAAGILICYDVADDYLVNQLVKQGADIIFLPTNNADFGQTDQNQQQLKIAQVRALETGRTVINISTVGTSAMVNPDGTILSQLTPYEPGAMVEEVKLATGTSPAVWLSWYLEAGLGLLVVGLMIACALVGFRHRKNPEAETSNRVISEAESVAKL